MGLGELLTPDGRAHPADIRRKAAALGEAAAKIGRLNGDLASKLSTLAQGDPDLASGLAISGELEADRAILLRDQDVLERFATRLDALEAQLAHARVALNGKAFTMLPLVLPRDGGLPWWAWTRISLLAASSEDAADTPTADHPGLPSGDAAVAAVSAWRRSRGTPTWGTEVAPPDAEPDALLTFVQSDAAASSHVDVWVRGDSARWVDRTGERMLPLTVLTQELAGLLPSGPAASEARRVDRDAVENLLAGDPRIREASVAALGLSHSRTQPWRAWAACVVRRVNPTTVDGRGVLIVQSSDGVRLARPRDDEADLLPASENDLLRCIAHLLDPTLAPDDKNVG